VGWCALAPREQYPVLDRSRVLRRVDQRPVWSVVCFFIARAYRRKGLAARLLEAAADYTRARGAGLVEGYPVAPRTGKMPDAFAWTGLPGSFERAGFVEVARRSPTRPIMRRELGAVTGPKKTRSRRG
jgi:GNAT superfamily N-acetyltransferase